MKYLIERRLAPRLAAIGLSDFGAYYRYLRYDARARIELGIAVELVLTHETYFFREVGQLHGFADEVFPAMVSNARSGRSPNRDGSATSR